MLSNQFPYNAHHIAVQWWGGYSLIATVLFPVVGPNDTSSTPNPLPLHPLPSPPPLWGRELGEGWGEWCG
jgi:hypothetical protein